MRDSLFGNTANDGTRSVLGVLSLINSYCCICSKKSNFRLNSSILQRSAGINVKARFKQCYLTWKDCGKWKVIVKQCKGPQVALGHLTSNDHQITCNFQMGKPCTLIPIIHTKFEFYPSGNNGRMLQILPYPSLLIAPSRCQYILVQIIRTPETISNPILFKECSNEFCFS